MITDMKLKPLRALLAMALALAVAAPGCARPGSPAAEGMERATVSRVVDGDTIVVDVGGEARKVRLIGIDCPESVAPEEERNTQEGRAASTHTGSVLPEGSEVLLQRDVSTTDKYGRYLYYVWLAEPEEGDGEEEIMEKLLNAEIVRAGYAQAKRYPPDTMYAGLLERAQALAAGEGAGVSALWR